MQSHTHRKCITNINSIEILVAMLLMLFMIKLKKTYFYTLQLVFGLQSCNCFFVFMCVHAQMSCSNVNLHPVF